MKNMEKDMKQLLSDEELKNVSGGMNDMSWEEWLSLSNEEWQALQGGGLKSNSYCNQYNPGNKEGCKSNSSCRWYQQYPDSDTGYCLQVKK